MSMHYSCAIRLVILSRSPVRTFTVKSRRRESSADASYFFNQRGRDASVNSAATLAENLRPDARIEATVSSSGRVLRGSRVSGDDRVSLLRGKYDGILITTISLDR